MKKEITKKALKSQKVMVLGISYCDPIHNIMAAAKTAETFCAGVYGWDCDNFGLGGGVVLSCGHRPLSNAKLNKSQKSAVESYAADLWEKVNNSLITASEALSLFRAYLHGVLA